MDKLPDLTYRIIQKNAFPEGKAFYLLSSLYRRKLPVLINMRFLRGQFFSLTLFTVSLKEGSRKIFWQ